MAIELKALLEKASQIKIQTLAGGENLSAMVAWVHIIEGPAALPYIGIGELAITTGAAMREDSENLLLPFVKELHARNAAGIILNTGPYISAVPQNVIDFCRDQDFPLFTVPWEVHISELMQIFCFALAEERQRGTDSIAAFKNAILFPEQPELYAVALSQADFQMEWSYAAIVIHPGDPDLMSEKSAEFLLYRLDNFLHHHYRHSIVFKMDDDILIITGNCSDRQLHTLSADIRNILRPVRQEPPYLTDTSRQEVSCRHIAYGEETADSPDAGREETEYLLGAGRLTQSIRCLCKSYSQARFIVNLHRNRKINPDLICYSEMGAYKLLMCIDDKEILREYFDSTIQPLLDYDEKKQSNLTEVVECYLNHNGSVKETAQELYLHRNTINYRINKAEDILQMNLSHHDARFQIGMGFLIRDLLDE